ncbi:MAG: TraM recognition domain-containing protein [Proteobacteria bacterium]|nr:TraM recognition domain-containing protein [Pseudomonadota bacterium]
MALKRNQRGLDASQEQNYKSIIRDTRPLSKRITDFWLTPKGACMSLIIAAMMTYFLNYLSELIFLIGVGVFLYCFLQKSALPFRMPLVSGAKDFNDLHPKKGTPNVARGIYFLGNELHTQSELWFSNEDMRTHALIFGSTGSGKTEALISIAYNALLQASGFIYVDGKGDNSLFAKIFSMVRSMGREDDLLLINFMTGARDVVGPQEKRLSNTLNPFATGSSSMLAQLIISMMESSAQSSDGDMWKGRAMGFVEAIMKVLVVMRDAGHILLDANTIRNYFLLSRLEAMVIDKLFIRDGQEAISLANLPPSILEPINNYVFNLPGYNKDKKGQQVSQVLEQHGFITMQLTRIFTTLADTYGHILRTNLAEVDLKDVVLNRRILCVLLPALEKSPEELSNLGKIIIATLRVMMASGLGDSVEGSYEDLITSKPTNSETPFLCILDEYGYYAVKGFAVVPAQARSLGFSVVFAGQDLPAFQKASKEEAASIGANCNIKVCMKLEDPTETWDFFMKSAGESYVTHVDSFQVDSGNVMGTYADAKGAKLEKRNRVDLLDLKEQQPGEAHFLFKSKIVRGRFFYAAPPPVKKMRLTHFLKVGAPDDNEVKKLRKSFDHFNKLVGEGTIIFKPEVTPEQEIDNVTQLLQRHQELTPIDRSVTALKKLRQGFSAQIPGLDSFTQEPVVLGNEELNIFVPMRKNEHLRQYLIDKSDNFQQPLLPRNSTRDQIEYLQRLCGKNSQQSLTIASELVRDMEQGTHYPPAYRGKLSIGEVITLTNNLIEAVNTKKQEAAAAKK